MILTRYGEMLHKRYVSFSIYKAPKKEINLHYTTLLGLGHFTQTELRFCFPDECEELRV